MRRFDEITIVFLSAKERARKSLYSKLYLHPQIRVPASAMSKSFAHFFS